MNLQMCLLTGGLCVGWLGSGINIQADEKPPVPAVVAESMDLVILANSPPDLTEAQLIETLNDAIAKTEGSGCDKDGIVVSLISEPTFNMVANLIRQGTQELPRAADGTISEVKNSNYWQVVIPNAKKPSGITVRYLSGKEGMTTTLTEDLQPMTKESARFRYSKPGLALFQTDQGWDMKEYALRYPSDSEPSLKFVPWPLGPKQFFIKLPEFTGGPEARERLFQTLAEGKIGTMLVNNSEERPVTIVHADFVSDTAEVPTDVISGNTYYVQFPAPEGQSWDPELKQGVARAWMLFPLTPEQKDQVLQTLESKPRTRKELSEFLRNAGTGFPVETLPAEGATVAGLQTVLEPNPNIPAPSAILSPDKQPAWYELPPRNNGGSVYGRSFQLQSVQEWKQNPSDIWRIYVYEFEFPLGDHQETRLLKFARNNRSSFWFPEQIQNWAAQLQKVPGAAGNN